MPSSAKQFSPSTGEALSIVIICFGLFIALSINAVLCGYPSGKTFNDSDLLRVLLLEIVMGAAALVFLKHRGHQLSQLLPSPHWRDLWAGVLLFTAAMITWAIVAMSLSFYRYEDQPIAEIVAQSHASILVVIVASVVNGLYEETFLLGYFVRGFQSHGAAFALGISLLVRMLYHLYQGPVGAASVLVFGGVLSYYYWRTRALWPAVLAHIVADVAALAR